MALDWTHAATRAQEIVAAWQSAAGRARSSREEAVTCRALNAFGVADRRQRY